MRICENCDAGHLVVSEFLILKREVEGASSLHGEEVPEVFQPILVVHAPWGELRERSSEAFYDTHYFVDRLVRIVALYRNAFLFGYEHV